MTSQKEMMRYLSIHNESPLNSNADWIKAESECTRDWSSYNKGSDFKFLVLTIKKTSNHTYSYL